MITHGEHITKEETYHGQRFRSTAICPSTVKNPWLHLQDPQNTLARKSEQDSQTAKEDLKACYVRAKSPQQEMEFKFSSAKKIQGITTNKICNDVMITPNLFAESTHPDGPIGRQHEEIKNMSTS
ncbi:hypothetical protein NC652_002093 [Populus alba x Populus x berolinensis]|nr:hypothetical protein NC652_002093 [Populus alba x Populus x berolinensis]